MSNERVKHLVVDTNSFIKNFSLEEVGEEIYTVPDALTEIRDSATRKRLNILPYEINYREPSSEIIQLINRFAKATGDYPVLSAVDIKIMALAYELTQEKLGPEASLILKTEPEVKKITVIHGPRLKSDYDMSTSEPDSCLPKSRPGIEKKNDFQPSSPEEYDGNNTNVIRGEGTEVDNSAIDNDEDEDLSDSEDSGDTDDDDEGWITPKNYKEKIAEMNKCGDEVTPENIIVACMTRDYAMQNVLLHAGVQVMSSEGMLIKHLRTYILRCYACFRTTSTMTKIFCPSCGNKTLKRVSVSYNSDGTQVIHLSKRVNITGRGKKFSLPTPKGGKHANNPYLAEDQNFPQQRPSKMAMKKNNPLGPDYIANVSPFATKDVYSRAAMLGITSGYTVTNYWDKKNPNESRKTSTGRKKKN